VQDRTNVTMTD